MLERFIGLYSGGRAVLVPGALSQILASFLGYNVLGGRAALVPGALNQMLGRFLGS